ncbi:chromate resistance protein ChrB domain-containing protein [Asticcacaulis sp.]|uniref:chromate resistance protein ChrB domain-containing protein n=1 Tax=Asticcacaulis sp. TaxID=1872648 RepID=UPI003F7CBB43
MKYLILILSLPTENATLRMRAWRAVKAAGAAALRDGVYVLPDRDDCRGTLQSVAEDVQSGNGTAFLVPVDVSDDPFLGMFDRSEDYAVLIRDVAAAVESLTLDTAGEVLKAARKLRKTFTSTAAIDYFPGQSREQASVALQVLERKVAQVLSPDEPHFVEHPLDRLAIADYQGLIWATRRRPWVDRLASAWLIRRFIDRNAKILWLATPGDCPNDVVGFDFDGANFTHVGDRVTFEILAESFGLTDDAMKRLGAIIHFLDVGGLQPPEAAGLEGVLKGMRDSILDDDQLLAAASLVFDGLFSAFRGSSHD